MTHQGSTSSLNNNIKPINKVESKIFGFREKRGSIFTFQKYLDYQISGHYNINCKYIDL